MNQHSGRRRRLKESPPRYPPPPPRGKSSAEVVQALSNKLRRETSVGVRNHALFIPSSSLSLPSLLFPSPSLRYVSLPCHLSFFLPCQQLSELSNSSLFSLAFLAKVCFCRLPSLKLYSIISNRSIIVQVCIYVQQLHIIPHLAL